VNAASKLAQQHKIPGRLAFDNKGGLLKAMVVTKWSDAEIYLHGAHVAHFQKNGEPPLLFVSEKAYFDPAHSIRGGVPIIFPWFGQRENAGLHGFARVNEWELIETSALPDGGVKLDFHLPENVCAKNGWPVAKVNFVVTVADKLTMELIVTNPAKENFTFEDCLHTYFEVGDISQISIAGLKGISYLDKTDSFARKLESGDAFKISSETDRVFPNASGTVEIRDEKLRRKILIEKSGSNSTVVWNPWIAKAKAMPDFGDEEYKQMVCVESGNVAENKITLVPGASATLKVVLSSKPI
jgi:D-hexose-6-phosphate mutarotase